MKDEDPTLIKYQNWALRLIIFGIVIIAIFVLIFIVYHGIYINGEYDPNITSSIGEFIGGIVGAVWALAGVLFFYVALRYQKREFQLQRKELIETRKILKSQSKTLKKQQFEGTFFELLKFFVDYKKSNDFNSDVLKRLSNGMKDGHDTKKEPYKLFLYLNDGNPPIRDKPARGLYKSIYSSRRGMVESYMGLLNSIISFVSNSEINNKEYYNQLINSTLLIAERYLIYCYCLSSKDLVIREFCINNNFFKGFEKESEYYEVLKSKI